MPSRFLLTYPTESSSVLSSLSSLPLPLIPFRERTEAWRIDVNTCALAGAHTHTDARSHTL